MTSYIRYIGVGLLANLVGLIAFQGLIILGSSPELATALAFFPAISCAYLLNRRWSFRSNVPHGKALLKYVVATVAVVLLQIAVVSVLVRGMDVMPLVAQIIALSLATPVSFLLLAIWVFERKTILGLRE